MPSDWEEDPGSCIDCGVPLIIVRPGKSDWQCKCWMKRESAVSDTEIKAWQEDRYYGSWESLIAGLINRVKQEQERANSFHLALAKFGGHEPECDHLGYPERDCTCGFTQAIYGGLNGTSS